MKVDLGIWDWLTRLIVFLLLGVAVVGVVLWYLPLIRTNESLRRVAYERQQEIRKEQAATNQLHLEIMAYDRKETIERLAREGLSLARSNEVVFTFRETPAEPVRR